MSKFTPVLLAFWLGATLAAAADAPATPPSVLNSVQWNGDLRYRHEMKNIESSTAKTLRHYHRFQARAGLKAKPNERSEVEMRLATGTGGQSTQQTLGDSNSFQNYTIKLDRAYFTYAPHEAMKFAGGRMKNFFLAGGGSDLLFDADLNFDGLAFVGDWQVGEAMSFGFTQATYWVSNGGDTPGTYDNLMISPQFWAKGKSETLSWGLFLGYHNFTHTIGQTASTTSTASGNTTTGTPSVLTQNYRLLNPSAEFGAAGFTVYGDYVLNTATENEKFGYLLGLRYGGLREPGDILFLYDFRRLKKDAAFAPYTDGDSGGGGTDIRSHRVKLGYQIDKNFNIAGAYFIGKSAMSTTVLKRNKLQIDLTFTF